MWLDAVLAYLHFSAVFLVFGFLTVEVMLVRQPIDARVAALLVRCDIWYAASAVAALVTGIARVLYGARGSAFYIANPVFWAKVGLFVAVSLVSIAPTIRFIRWLKRHSADPRYAVPDAEQRRVRRLVMVELHLLAFVPLAAVLMARGIGH